MKPISAITCCIHSSSLNIMLALEQFGKFYLISPLIYRLNDDLPILEGRLYQRAKINLKFT